MKAPARQLALLEAGGRQLIRSQLRQCTGHLSLGTEPSLRYAEGQAARFSFFVSLYRTTVLSVFKTSSHHALLHPNLNSYFLLILFRTVDAMCPAGDAAR